MKQIRQSWTGWNGHRPVVATILRYLMTACALTGALVACVEGRALIAQGCMNVMAGDILLFLVAVPCTVLAMFCGLIAFGLHRGSLAWMRTALTFDAVVVVGLLAGLSLLAHDQVVEGDSESLSTRLLIGGGMGTALLLCAAEAASLLHACRGNAVVWRIFGVLAALVTVLAVALPLAARSAHRRHVEPLREFAAAHWFAIPADAQACVTRGRAPDGRHEDELQVQAGDRTWRIMASHEPGRGWVGGPGHLVAWANGPYVDTTTEWSARGRLGQVGVADRWFEPIGTHTQRDHQALCRFNAAAAGGVYEVTEAGWVLFRLESSVSIPERR